MNASGLPEGSLKFLLALLATYPLAMIGCMLPRGVTRHLCDAIFGSLLLQFVFGGAWIYVPISAALTWLALTISLPAFEDRKEAKEGSESELPKLGKTPWWHVAGCSVAFFFLFYRHIMRPDAATDAIDDCAAQMVLVVKLTSLAFAAYDGSKPELAAARAISQAAKEAKGSAHAAKAAHDTYKMDPALKQDTEQKVKASKALSKAARLADQRLATCLPQVPSFLETMGYCLCPQTALVGPSFQPVMYLNGQAAYTVTMGSVERLDNPSTAFSVLPTRIPRVLFLFLSGLFFLGLNAPMTAYVPLESLYNPKTPVPLLGVLGYTVRGAGGSAEDLAIEAASGSPPASVTRGDLPAIALLAYIALVAVRFQYYGVWLLAEGAGVAQGFGFVKDKGSGAKAAKMAADPAEAGPHTAQGAGVGPVSGRQPASVAGGPGSSLSASPSTSSAPSERGAVPGTKIGPGTGSQDGAITKGSWTGISNIDVLQCEFSPSLSTVIRNWNKQVQGWLLKDVYGRFPPGSAMAKFATIGASALWHGFYSGYYVGFFQVILAQEAQAALYKVFKPLLVGASNQGVDGVTFLTWLGSFVGLTTYKQPRMNPDRPHLPMWAVPIACFLVSMVLNYSMAPFPLLYLDRGLGFYTMTGYYLHPFMLAVLVAGPLFGMLWRLLGVGRTGRGKGKGAEAADAKKKQ